MLNSAHAIMGKTLLATVLVSAGLALSASPALADGPPPGPVLQLAAADAAAAGNASTPPAVGGRAVAKLPPLDAATEKRIRARVDAWLKGRFPVDEVRPTPLAGLFEVRLGRVLVYVDQQATHAIVEGQLVDLDSGTNLTKDRMAELDRVDFKDLPLQDAIKTVQGNGRRTLAIFEDPNCGYCKRLRTELGFLSDVTIYTFPYPILAKDSAEKARKAWCAEDRGKAWDDLLINSKVPANDGACDNPIERVLALGRSLNVTGTPTMFFTNGARLPGAVPLDEIERKLDEAEAASAEGSPASKS